MPTKSRPTTAKASKPAATSTKPAVAKPAAKKPVASKAAPAKAVAKKPVVAKPVAKKPVVAKKPASKPQAAKPVAKVAAKAVKAAPAKPVAAKKPAPAKAKPVVKASSKPVAKAAPVKPVAKKPAPAKPVAAAKPAPKVVEAKAAKPAPAPKSTSSALTPKPGFVAKSSPRRETSMSDAPKKPITGKFESANIAGGRPVITASMGFTSPYSADELSKWRQRLLTQRAQITSDISDLEKDAMEAEDGHTTPLHAAERGSDADLQDVSLALAGEEKNLLWQIDRALRKIEVGRPLPFGLCEHTREPINKGRLETIPWTPLSIEGATHLEENGMTVEDLLLDD